MTNAEIVHAWFQQRLSAGIIARSTEARNQVFGELSDLIARLDDAEAPAAAVKPEPKAAAPVPEAAAAATTDPTAESAAAEEQPSA